FQTDSIFYEKNIQKLGNGWYEIIKQKKGQYTFVSLIQIYRCYEHENQYLQSGFSADFHLSDNYLFTAHQKEMQVQSKNGDFLFSILLQNPEELPQASYYFFTILFFLGIAIFLLLISKIPSLLLRSISAILFLIIARIAMGVLRIPQSMYK